MKVKIFGIPTEVDLRAFADFLEGCLEISNDEINEAIERKEAERVVKSIKTFRNIEDSKIEEERKLLYKSLIGKKKK